MKVKQTVAALCMAAIMATSVCASAYGSWQSSKPNSKVGAWEHGSQGSYVGAKIYSYFYPAKSDAYAGAYVQGNSINNYKMIHTTGGTAAIATTKQDGYTEYDVLFGTIKFYNHYEYWSWGK